MAIPKVKKKKARALPRQYDMVQLGLEPTWTTTPVDENERLITLAQTFQWYNYFDGAKDNRRLTLKFCKEQLSYRPSELSLIRECSDWEFGAAGKLIRMHFQGWELNEDELSLIRQRLEGAMKQQSIANAKAAEEAKKNSGPPPIRNIYSVHIENLDAMEDAWINGNYNVTYNFFEQQSIHNENKATLEVVRAWVEGRLEEYNTTEGNEHISHEDRKKAIATLEGIIGDMTRTEVTKKVSRKPRRKKQVSAEKLVDKLNFKAKDDEFKIESIPRVHIIGAKVLYIFNTKYRTLIEYVSDTGFSVKGQGLLNYDPDKARSIKLRSPEEFLPIVLSKTPKQIDKEWKQLTTKTAAANGRFTKDMVILRAK